MCIFLLNISLIQAIMTEIPVNLQDSLFCMSVSIKKLHFCIIWKVSE